MTTKTTMDIKETNITEVLIILEPYYSALKMPA